MTRRWALRLTACLLAGAATLTGCSEKQEASESLPTTSSTAPSEEALPPLGPEDFPVPDEARTKDATGAKAFLRYWIELLNRQQAIPAGQPLRDLGPRCLECLRIADAFDDAAAVGSAYEGGELRLNDVAEPQFSGDEASINFGVRVEPVLLRDSAGRPVPDGQGSLAPNAGSGITLVWSEPDTTWLVIGMTIG